VRSSDTRGPVYQQEPLSARAPLTCTLFHVGGGDGCIAVVASLTLGDVPTPRPLLANACPALTQLRPSLTLDTGS